MSRRTVAKGRETVRIVEAYLQANQTFLSSLCMEVEGSIEVHTNTKAFQFARVGMLLNDMLLQRRPDSHQPGWVRR